jgi:N-acetylmuramoyl-L-alanine amidase
MSLKRKIQLICILLLCLLTANVSLAQKVNTIVLDAGHGGHDTGALGKHSREKDITLEIVLKLQHYFHEHLKDVKVILTRDKDEFVELYRRARIANENKADLFISVHCNANPSSSPFGTETYVMGLHKSNANLAVAKAENAAILLEDDYVEQYDGFDPNSPEGNIFFSMMQNAFLDNSLDVAGRLQRQFREKLKLADRGVKQAGFLVLYKTAMPGVLIETGFISNSKDEKYLISEKGQDQIALSIFRAVREYKFALEKRNLAEIGDTFEVAEVCPDNGSKDEQVMVPEDSASFQSEEAARVIYRVQFASSPEEKPVIAAEFKGLRQVWKYYQNGLYKYTAGYFRSFGEASEYRTQVINKGFKDAFVVPFFNNKRITIEEARRLEKN